MSQEIAYSYDEEVDVLYISFSPGEKATAAVGLHDNILLRFNRAQQRAVGLTLLDFSLLVQPANLGPRSFPLTGLTDLEPDWQDTVAEIISKPPVSQVLKISVYSPSLTETMPIAMVGKPPYRLAA